MGGSLCARRSTTVESKQSDPALFKHFMKSESKVEKKVDSKVATAPLPTKSWASLLKEAPLNLDAQSFKPAGIQGRQQHKSTEQSTKLPPGLEAPVSEWPGPEPPGKMSIDLISADKNDPEWMQYLSKKFQIQGVAKSVDTGPSRLQGCKGTKRNLPRCSNRSSADGLINNHAACDTTTAINNEAKSTGAAPVSSVVIHTDEYLKMLKEGNSGKPKSRSSQPAHNGSLGGKGKLGKGKLRGSLNIHQYPATSGEAPCNGLGFDLNVSIRPITASGLANRWANALKTNAAVENAPEELLLTTQDDLEVEKTVLDQDLSDPAYWSETECVACKGPSAHPFGRRPRTSKSMVRSYVMQDLSFDLDRAVGMLLLRLQRFTNHHKAFGVRDMTFMDRRFVIGLKEVSRRTKQARVECLIVAPDIEEDAESGGLDDRMRELLAAAYQNKIPVIFALSRTRMGQALGKSLHISVLGLLNTTGAHELMGNCLQLANDCRQAWLSRVPA